MADDRRKLWLPLGLLAGALVVWAGLFALGAYLEWGADQPRHDIRKPIIVMGTMAAFLALWGVALLVRARRPPRD
jgi:type VI protein secretion system component VasK